MIKFETALLSSVKTILDEKLKALEESLWKNKIGSGDDLQETSSGSNSQADLKRVFNSRLRFTDGIEGRGIDSKLIVDAGKLKYGSENIDLIGAEPILSKIIENEIDVNLESISFDLGDSSSLREFIQNSSTPRPVEEVRRVTYSEVEDYSSLKRVTRNSYNSSAKDDFFLLSHT